MDKALPAETDTLTGIFAASVRRGAETVAVNDGITTLTYQELDRRSDALARGLVSRGVGGGSLVAIALERSALVPVAILGVLKSGAAYVPLDSANPESRLRLILDDAQPRVLLTQTSLEERYRDHGQIMLIGEAEGHGESGDALPHPTGDSVAYVIYTSGTTGRPKGVPVTHHNVARLMHSTEHLFGFGPDDVWTLFHSYAFDFSVWEMWGALAYGGRLTVPSAETVQQPDDFYDLLGREGVTVLCQTPSAFTTLLDVERHLDRPEPPLRHIIFGGEELDPRRLLPWIARHGDDAPVIVNMYGITETTVHSTYRRILRADAEVGQRLSPIGVPLPDLDILLLDSDGSPVPDGDTGEILVVGDGVTPGYLNRPDETATRFIPSPADGRPAYRSGDLAYRLPSGELVFQGRLDSQVQIRGFRVELGEITAALQSHDSVVEAAVDMKNADGPTGGRLVGYAVLKAGTDLDAILERDMREHLGQRLPPYMVPYALVSLDALPLTVNGKVDRAALPEPHAHRGPTVSSPSTPTARRLAAIWARLLERDDLDHDSDFFAAGGHSLLAVEAMIQARDDFGVDVPLGALFSHTQLGELADFIDELLGDTGATTVEEVEI